MRTFSDHVLDMLRRFLGHLVDHEGNDEVDQRTDCTEGFRRDAEEAVGAADGADKIGALMKKMPLCANT